MPLDGVAPIKPEYLRQPPKYNEFENGNRDVQSKFGNSDDGGDKNRSPTKVKEEIDDDDDGSGGDDSDVGESAVEKMLDASSSSAVGGDRDRNRESQEDLDEKRKRKKEEKKKYRGQNKKRPRPQRPKADERLCPSIMDGRECRFGSSCRYGHNLEAFWRSKPADIGDRCPNFEAFGKCFYGFSCRFANSHVDTKEWKNVENPEKASSAALKKTDELNKFDKSVQSQLRKRQYNFERSYQIVEKFAPPDRRRGGDQQPSNVQDVVKPKVDAAVDSSAQLPSSAVETAEIVVKEKRVAPRLDWGGKLYLAPLTTVGNLPFRRICTELGADITCGEMTMAFELLQGHASEWALVNRHPCERTFGVQVCGNYPDVMTKCAQVLTEQLEMDFIDINVGCPIDLVCERGAGCSLMMKQTRLEQIVQSMRDVMPGEMALTVKMRTGYYENKFTAHYIAPKLADHGVSLYTIHGRSREQRYTKTPDWQYIAKCARAAAPLPIFGCGDVLTYEEYYQHLDELIEANTTDQGPGEAGIMIARGALIKPWIFTEIKERRHWDISSGERLDILRKYANYGLQHWGSDQQGVSNTRRFMLEWLSFLHRYIPVGVLERLPQKINERPPTYVGRDDLETMMASSNCSDWVKITEMLLGPVERGFSFLPKHKANSY